MCDTPQRKTESEAQKLYENMLDSAADIVDLANAFDYLTETATGNFYAMSANWLRLDKYKMAAALFFQCPASEVTKERRQVGKLLTLRWLRQTMDKPKGLTEQQISECERSTDEQLATLFAKTGRPKWEPDGDIYSLVAACMYGVRLDDVTESLRQLGKAAVVKASYGGVPERPVIDLPHNSGKTCSRYHPARKEMLHKMAGSSFVVQPIDSKNRNPHKIGWDGVYIPLPEYGVALWHAYEPGEREAAQNETKELADATDAALTELYGEIIPPGTIMFPAAQIDDETVMQMQTEFAHSMHDAYSPSRHYNIGELVAYKGHTWKAAGADCINIAPNDKSGDWELLGWDTENRDVIFNQLGATRQEGDILLSNLKPDPLQAAVAEHPSDVPAENRPSVSQCDAQVQEQVTKIVTEYLQTLPAKTEGTSRELSQQWKAANDRGNDVY